MGQKVNPKSYRMNVIYSWTSKWFGKKDFATKLEEDTHIRKYLQKKLKEALIDRIEIERSLKNLRITIHAARPGIVIGRKGEGVEAIKKEIFRKFLKGQKVNIQINIEEVKRPNLSAAVVMHNIIFDIEKRVPYRRAIKTALSRIEKTNALGAKIIVAGRLNGAEIARSESVSYGKIPLHTLRADIDYCRGAAGTTYGAIGVKVWIYKGEVFNKKGVEKTK